MIILRLQACTLCNDGTLVAPERLPSRIIGANKDSFGDVEVIRPALEQVSDFLE